MDAWSERVSVAIQTSQKTSWDFEIITTASKKGRNVEHWDNTVPNTEICFPCDVLIGLVHQPEQE